MTLGWQRRLRQDVMSGAVATWCPCYGTPEPSGRWMYPDDEHADTCHFDYGIHLRGDRSQETPSSEAVPDDR